MGELHFYMVHVTCTAVTDEIKSKMRNRVSGTSKTRGLVALAASGVWHSIWNECIWSVAWLQAVSTAVWTVELDVSRVECLSPRRVPHPPPL